MKYRVQSFLILLFLFSCGNPMGDIVKTKNLDVYYINGVDKQQAVAFTRFWKRNGFIGKDKQTIQLDLSSNHIVNVNVIEKKFYQNKPLTLQDQMFLTKIQTMLRDSVFENKRVNIVITDNTFKPLQRDL